MSDAGSGEGLLIHLEDMVELNEVIRGFYVGVPDFDRVAAERFLTAVHQIYERAVKRREMGRNRRMMREGDGEAVNNGCCPIGLINQMRYDAVTGCWNFTGCLTSAGYGYVSYKSHKVTVHRLAAHLWLRFDLDSDLCVLHRCDNKVCFNPKHLFIGTKADNAQDAIAKGLVPQCVKKALCRLGHPITTVGKYRVCPTCARRYKRDYELRLRARK
jgi:hypothetical protein